MIWNYDVSTTLELSVFHLTRTEVDDCVFFFRQSTESLRNHIKKLIAIPLTNYLITPHPVLSPNKNFKFDSVVSLFLAQTQFTGGFVIEFQKLMELKNLQLLLKTFSFCFNGFYGVSRFQWNLFVCYLNFWIISGHWNFRR